jgi:hypothetical protein
MLDLWVRTPEENKYYNLPKWQNKTKKSDKGIKIPAAVQRRLYL